MENATKALLIAAGVLIAMMILSMGVYFILFYRLICRKITRTNSTTGIR